MTRGELNQQRQRLLAEYAAARHFGETKKMDAIRKAGLEVKERLANMCYKCKENERDERYGEGSYCSQECWDSYYPQRPNWEESKRKIRERAKAKHTKGVSK
jgi:hypothetical protein